MGGVCETKNNTNNNIPLINIEKGSQNISKPNPNLKEEAIFPGKPVYINDQQLKVITHQKDHSICKIIKNDVVAGTGFLCAIPGEYKTRKTLITAYHVLGEEDLKIGNEIKISFKDNAKLKIIKIDDKRRIYASRDYDTTMIEIIDDDNLKSKNFLEIEEKLLGDNINFNKEYSNKTIYILHYPNGLFSSFSNNIIERVEPDNTIRHYCATDSGSSGSPILNLDTLKVIGIHQGADKVHQFNIGFMIKDPILNFNKENKIIITLEVKETDIGEKIYFLGKTSRGYWFLDTIHYGVKFYDKINKDNAILIINNKLCTFNNYLIPKNAGIYTIKIILTQLIDDCGHLFDDCKNIT